MNILLIGDVVGDVGCEALRRYLPKIKREYNIDLTIVNGENSAEGNGITPHSAEHIFTSGADVITGGNHTIRRREVYEMLENNEFMLRPANYPASISGKGLCIVDLGYTKVAVINVLGTVYLESLECPFNTCDKLIEKAKAEGADIIIVDIHAEATSEKRAMGFYLDSRVTALFGTHTHVQTNDMQILSGGTAYVTDIGMTGAMDSVLGVKPEIAIAKMKDKLPIKFLNQTGRAMINGCVITVDKTTKKATKIIPINIKEEN